MKDCNQCGKCCVKYGADGLSVSEEEVDWWKASQPQIFSYVAKGEVWFQPKTGKRVEVCPWLRKEQSDSAGREIYTCDIYFNRPDDCKHYPTSIDEMIRDGCEMLDEQDIAEPVKAQKRLDVLMIDSRPSLEN